MTAPSGGILASVSTNTGTYKDLADFNFAFGSAEGLFGRAGTIPSAVVPGRIAQALLSSRVTGSPRSVTVDGFVRSSSAAQLTTDLRALIGWCARAVAIKTGHDATSFLNVRGIDVQAPIPNPQLVQTQADVRLIITADDPRWYHTTLSAVTFSTNTAMPLGDAPVDPVIRLTGILTNPTITLKDSTGATVGTIALTIALPGASDYVEIDCARKTIVKSVSSVVSNAIDTLTSGDFPTLDPANADTVTPTWPSLSVAYSAGSGTAVSTFRKTYW